MSTTPMSTNPRRGIPFEDALVDYRAKLSPAERGEFDEGVKCAAREQAAERVYSYRGSS